MIFSTALFQLSLRQMVGWRRLGLLFFLMALGALPVLIAAVTLQAVRFDPSFQREFVAEDFLTGLFANFQLPLLYPVMLLILMATVLRAEIQDETIVYLWMKPIGRGALVISKYLAALLIGLLLAGVSLLLAAAIVTNNWDFSGKLLLAAIIALPAYGAFFLALSVFFDRALVWGFAYLLGWEQLFSRISTAASQLSFRQHAENLVKSWLDPFGEASLASPVGVLVALTVVLLGLAIWRFSHMEFPDSSE